MATLKGGRVDASGEKINSIRLVTDTDASAGLGDVLDPMRVDPTGTTVQPVSISGIPSVTASGTVTANQGTPGATAWKVDGSGVIQPENLAQVGGVAISLGQKTMASSVPVVLASDESNLATVLGGTIKTYIVSPAAGAEISLLVPANKSWRIISIRFTLVSSSTVANRQPRLVLSDSGSSGIFAYFSSASQPASSSVIYNGVPGLPSNQIVGPVHTESLIALPAFAILGSGWKLSTATDNLQVGDQYNSVVVAVLEW